MMSVTEEVFLQLVRLGIGTYTKASLPENVNWEEVIALAERQRLSAIILDGIESFPEKQRPPQIVLLNLIGEILQNYEGRYAQYKGAISSLAGFYNQHGFKMMELKGYACSLDWPKPEHRPCGDIDIWLLGHYKEADAALRAWFKSSKVQGFEIDNSHHHHTTFSWRDFLVENHYDFINVHHHKSNVELDRFLKELALDDSYYVEVNGEKIHIPSPNFHAFFLMRHIMNHFSSSEITMRQLLDWVFFCRETWKGGGLATDT